MLTTGLKFVFSTDQGRWGLGTLATLILFSTGYVQLSLLTAVYSQMFFISHAVDQAAGNPTDSSELMMEQAGELMETMFGEQPKGDKQ